MDTCRYNRGPHSDRLQIEYQSANVAEDVVEAFISIQFSVLGFGYSRDGPPSSEALRRADIQRRVPATVLGNSMRCDVVRS